MQSTIISSLPLSVIAALLTMLIQRRHILMCLLALEAMILMLLLFIMSTSPSILHVSFIMLTVGACEASVGLACLVLMIRSYGNDLISSMNTNKC